MGLGERWDQAKRALHDRAVTRRAWGEADSLDDLGRVTERWLDGEVRETPYHGGPPDSETAEIREDLRYLNRCGFVTTNSEPGSVAYGQHAGVWGNTDATTAGKIAGASRAAGLDYRDCNVADGGRGHDLKWGRFALSDGAWDELDASVDVQVRDPEMGRERHLWDTLRAALEPQHEDGR